MITTTTISRTTTTTSSQSDVRFFFLARLVALALQARPFTRAGARLTFIELVFLVCFGELWTRSDCPSFVALTFIEFVLLVCFSELWARSDCRF